MIDKAEESYRIFKKTGRIKEAKAIKTKLIEAKYAKEHLIHVMNMDFSKPTQKMVVMAKKNKIDLNDPAVIAEFRKIQQQNLDDIRRMKEGKKPLTDQELQQKLKQEREQQDKMYETLKILEETEKEKDKSMRELIESTLAMTKENEEKLKQTIKKDEFRHYIALGDRKSVV